MARRYSAAGTAKKVADEVEAAAAEEEKKDENVVDVEYTEEKSE